MNSSAAIAAASAAEAVLPSPTEVDSRTVPITTVSTVFGITGMAATPSPVETGSGVVTPSAGIQGGDTARRIEPPEAVPATVGAMRSAGAASTVITTASAVGTNVVEAGMPLPDTATSVGAAAVTTADEGTVTSASASAPEAIEDTAAIGDIMPISAAVGATTVSPLTAPGKVATTPTAARLTGVGRTAAGGSLLMIGSRGRPVFSLPPALPRW
jgi:hypothetical protein